MQLHELDDALDEIRPSNDSKLLKIKKALEADYKKSLLDIVDVEELNLLKRHFNKIIDSSNLTIDEISIILDKYVEASNNEPYSKLIKNIKLNLITQKISIDDFLSFIEKFVVQNFPIDVFYKKFFKQKLPQSPKPTLTDLFGDELSDLSSDEESDSSSESSSSSSDEDENQKLTKIQNKIKSVKRTEQQSIQVIEPQLEKKQGRITLVKVPPIPEVAAVVSKPEADRTFFQTMDSLTKKDCKFFYTKLPWVKDCYKDLPIDHKNHRVNHIYVHPIEGDFDNLLDMERFIEFEGVKFYQPTDNYYAIQCYSFSKVQEGHELTIVKNKKTYKLKIAIDTNKGIVLQNEDMLKAEIDYIQAWNENKDKTIKNLEKSKPDDNMVYLAKLELSNALQEAISGNVPIDYRSVNSSFIITVVDTIFKNTNSGKSFVRLLAGIIIFLKINISFIASSVFIKRLRDQVYLPGTIPFLTDADKLPEIFLVQNVPADTKNFVLKKLDEEKETFTKNFFENLNMNFSTIRKPTKPTLLWNKPIQQIELPDIKTICKNRSEIEHENDEDLVFYTDLDEIYCFNVYQLYNSFVKDEFPTNPYTGRLFSDKFINTFLTRYASKPQVKKNEHVNTDNEISELEQLIEKELTMLENNLIETENPIFIEKFKNSVLPDSTKTTKKINPITDKNDKCIECKAELNSDKISSVFRNKQIFFCGYNCLEKNKSFK